MNFDARIASLLKESPDETFKPSTREILIWKEHQARPFGFVDLSNKQVFKDSDTGHELEFSNFGPEWHDRIYVSHAVAKTHGNLFHDKVVPELEQSKQGTIKLFQDGDLILYINFAESNSPEKMGEFVDEMSELEAIGIRSMLAPAGRIWTDSKVISFWVPRTEVTSVHLDKIAKAFNIDPHEFQSYELEFIGDEQPEITVNEFHAGTKSSEANTPEHDEERAQRIKDALRKVHVAGGGTKDVDVQNIIKDRKSNMAALDHELRTQGKIPSLKTRQQAMTSESLEINNSMTPKFDSLYEQVLEESLGKTLGAIALAVAGIIGGKAGIDHAEHEYSAGLPSLKTPSENAAKSQLDSYLNKVGLIKSKADDKHIKALGVIAKGSPDESIRKRAEGLLAKQARIATMR